MNHFELLLLSWLLNSLWQIPLICAAAWLAARVIRPAGPAAEHRVWVGALLCESLLPALSLVPWGQFLLILPWHAGVARGEGNVSVQMGAGSAFGAVQLPSIVLAGCAGAYIVVTAYFAFRFLWQCARLPALSRKTEPLVLSGDPAISLERWTDRFGAGPIPVFASDRIFAPVTIGFLRKRILLPSGIVDRLSQSDLDTAIAHELAHIRRHDFLKNLLYELLSLPVSYHPCLWFTRQGITETREMICDDMAAEVAGNHEYAQSLLRLATMLLQGGPVRVPQAIGVFDTNTLERRLITTVNVVYTLKK